MNTRPQLSELAGNKIVILIGHFGRGGAERQAYLLARELRNRHGLDMEVWALTHGGEYSKEFEAVGVPTKALGFHCPEPPLGFVRALQWVRRLRRVVLHLREARADILLPFTAWPNVVAGLTYRLAGVRLCIWGERHCGGERVPGVERLAVRQYRQFVANSTAGIDFLADEMRVARERISFVPNGVEEPKIDPGTDWRAQLGLHCGQPLVIQIANIQSRKDHATLLRAWKLVQDAWLGADLPYLALAGHLGDRYEECQRIASEAGLDSTVRFLGSIPDAPALIHACDVAAFSSKNEGMPNGVLECMAAGKAVIASDLPGVRDAMGSEAAGSLVTPGDAGELARKLLELLRDKQRRDALGEANRVRTRTEFSVERMVQRHLKIIQANLPDDSLLRRREAKAMGGRV